MRRLSLYTALAGLLALSAYGCAVEGSSEGPDGTDPLESEQNYIAILSSSTTATAEADTERLAAEYGFKVEATWAHVLQGIKMTATPDVVAALAADPEVAYIEPDGLTVIDEDVCDLVPDLPACDCEAFPTSPFCGDPVPEPGEPGEPGQPGEPGEPGNPGEIIPPGIEFVGGPIAATDKIAWIIDSGIDLDHPDLNVDVGLSTFFTGNSPEDEFQGPGGGHGTRVAGIIAAIDNDIGVVGVSPGNTVVAVRTQGANGAGAVSALVAGINYVVENGTPGDVINMSVSAVGQFQSLEDAVLAAAAKGFRFALSAGNAAQDVDASSTVPARVNHPNVFTVSAIGPDGCLADFSNFGLSVDLSGPGVDIVSTAIGGGIGAPVNGTSFSAPLVAGLLLHKTPVSRGTACGDPDGKADPLASF
jgi:hypothetical protein